MAAAKVVHEIPDVRFPVFPAPDGAVYNGEDDTVTVSGDWWALLAAYKADVDAVELYIERLKALEDTE